MTQDTIEGRFEEEIEYCTCQDEQHDIKSKACGNTLARYLRIIQQERQSLIKKEEKHCEKCSYASDEGLVISGCAYCGCHFSSTIADRIKEEI